MHVCITLYEPTVSVSHPPPDRVACSPSFRWLLPHHIAATPHHLITLSGRQAAEDGPAGPPIHVIAKASGIKLAGALETSTRAGVGLSLAFCKRVAVIVSSYACLAVSFFSDLRTTCSGNFPLLGLVLLLRSRSRCCFCHLVHPVLGIKSGVDLFAIPASELLSIV